MYVTSNNATKMIAKYGNMYLITLSIVTPPTRQPVKRIVPTGGVIVPIDKLKQSRIPNCIGLMPNAVHIGSKIGVKIRIAGVTSINVPTTSNSTFIKRRISILLSVRPRIAVASLLRGQNLLPLQVGVHHDNRGFIIGELPHNTGDFRKPR